MTSMPFLIIVPLAAAFFIALFGGRLKKLADGVFCLAVFSTAALAILTVLDLRKSALLLYPLSRWSPPQGLAIGVDGFSGLILVTANVVASLVALYAVGYMERYTSKWKFYYLFLVLLTGINGVLMATDIFNLYVFLEMAAIAGYFLVAFGAEAENLEASFKYAVMGAVASCFILLGIALLYLMTGTLFMPQIALTLAQGGAGAALPFVMVLFLAGFGLKAALTPFHAWLPYAHSAAPAPVSAMLSGIVIKTLGLYALARIFFNVFGVHPAASMMLVVFAVLSMGVGSLMAFGQTDIKRLFAYSSISQVGYIALGLGVGTPLGILGALFHLVNHSVFKSLLFMTAGSIEHLTGTRDLRKIRGIAAICPVTGYSNLVASFSICGIPPLGGFWSKLMIIYACAVSGHTSLAIIAAVVAVMTMGYYFKFMTPVLFGTPAADAGTPRKGRLPLSMTLPMILLAGMCLASVLLIVPGFGAKLLMQATLVLGRGGYYSQLAMGLIQ